MFDLCADSAPDRALPPIAAAEGVGSIGAGLLSVVVEATRRRFVVRVIPRPTHFRTDLPPPSAAKLLTVSLTSQAKTSTQNTRI